MEKQRSRISWLKEGDQNTNFYRAKCKERAKTNHISALRIRMEIRSQNKKSWRPWQLIFMVRVSQPNQTRSTGYRCICSDLGYIRNE